MNIHDRPHKPWFFYESGEWNFSWPLQIDGAPVWCRMGTGRTWQEAYDVSKVTSFRIEGTAMMPKSMLD